MLWQMSARDLKEAAFSTDGKYIGLVAKDGTIRCMDTSAKEKWSVHVSDAEQMQIGRNAEYCAAYSLLNPTHTRINFIDKNGRIYWNTKVKGAPWSAAVSVDEPVFAIGTGENYVYVYSLTNNHKRYKRWKADGAPTSLAFDPSSDGLVVGTWQDSSVGLFLRDGDSQWVKPGEPDKLYFVQIDRSSTSLLALALPNRRLPHAVLSLIDKNGATIWNKDVDGEEARASLSPAGRHAAVGFLTYLEHKGKRIPERHVSFYNDRGRLLWDRGGMFFKPRLISVLSSSEVLVFDNKLIYTLDEQGKVSAKANLPAVPQTFWTDRTGRQVLISSGGKLYYFTVK
jgi:WD40 repeat protein